MDKVYTQHWIELPMTLREYLRKAFSVARSGITEVRDQTLISDGTTNQDLASAFTMESMSAYTGKQDSFPHLWELTVIKARIDSTEPEVLQNVPSTPTAPSNKFCDKCDSLGVRHKKICPNYIDYGSKK